VSPSAIPRRLFCAGLATGAAALGVRGVRTFLARDLAHGSEAATIRALARGVIGWTRHGLGSGDFATGSRRFSGEWAFGTLLMAVMGLGQLALEAPSDKPELVRVIEDLVDRLLDPSVSAFSRDAWGSDPFAGIDTAKAGDEALDGHAAYLGYLNLGLGLLRSISPETRHAELGARVTLALHRRVERSPRGLVETYPRETYPVDNAALLASLHLGEVAASAPSSASLRRGLAALAQSIDEETGLLLQSVDVSTGERRDAPRGSGTCLAVYFTSFVDEALSRSLWASAKRELVGEVLGFRVVREYAKSAHGPADIDSGPVVLGYGVSASGFALGAARIHGDDDLRAELYATASLFGAPTRVAIDASPSSAPDGLRFVTGGPLGDALLLAMLTAPRRSVSEPRSGEVAS
jgi:hypothetical protein